MFRIYETKENSVIELEIQGDVTKEDYELLETAIQEKIKKVDKVNLLVRITELSNITAEAIVKDFKVGVKHYSDIRKMAVVSSKEWVEWLAKLGAILPVDIKYFKNEEIAAAWKWIKGLT